MEACCTSIKRVKDLLKVNLLEITEGDLINTLIKDPILLCDIVFVMCKPQADHEKVTDEDFGLAMRGDAIDDATKALIEEMVDFSPSPRERAVWKKAMAMVWKTTEQAHDILDEKMDKELERLASLTLENARKSFGDAPASSESTPAP